MQSTTSRRAFLGGAIAGLGAIAAARIASAVPQKLPHVRTITSGPKHHWFGYYDKLQVDPTNRYVLGMEVGFEHRSPNPDDEIVIGMVDLHDGDRWIELGRSKAWCWQQGCMLQWIPGSKSQILWNDRDGSQFVCRILDVETRQSRTIPHPIYALSPDGKTAIVPNFSRLADMRPGYGYSGVPDPHSAELAPKENGIFRIDLATGESKLLFSVADVVGFGQPLPSMRNTKHWFNHLLFNPDGSRFVFLHRWKAGEGRETRMLTADADGSNLRILDDNGLTSHFNWRDRDRLLAFSNQPSHGRRFYLFQDDSDAKPQVVGPDAMVKDGHCSYLPNREWILNDTYPDNDRMQNPYLFHVPSGRVVPLGHFRSPDEYTGEWRCDTHPRISADGNLVVIDSPHNGQGRQLHVIDLRQIVS